MTIVAACYELISTYHLEIQKAQIQSSNLSHVLDEQMNATFKKVDLVMLELSRVMKKENKFTIKNNDEIHELLNERRRDLPETSTFSIIDRDGYLAYSNTNFKNFYIGDREHFIHHANSEHNEFYISKPIKSKINGAPTIYFSRKLVDKKNAFRGIISTGIPLSYFRDIYSKLDIGSEGAITLYSNENILYSRFPWDESLVGKSLKNEEAINSIFNQKAEVHNMLKLSTVDGLYRYTSSRRIGDTKFLINVGISKSEALIDWKKRVTFYIFGFITLWSCSIIYLINFLRSLQELENRRKMAIHTAKLSSLGEMAAGIAHEINNPLAVISTRTMQLRRQIDRNQFEAESFKDSLNKINITVDRIAKIIRGLKSFSRNADNDAFAQTPLPLIVENALELCNERFRHQLVILKVDPIPNVLIDCREAQLVQVILNILSNAYDAVENLKEKWVHLTFHVNKFQVVTVTITDSGQGIPEKVAHKIMQPFFTTKEIGKGTGLGLSISKGIIEDHKGKIFLDQSTPNTTFVLALPFKTHIKEESFLDKLSS